MYTTAEADFTASGTADILVDHYIPLWGCPVTLLSDDGLQFCAKLSRALYERLGVNKIFTSSYHPCTNRVVQRVNHTMALMLATVGNELQNDWGLHLPHIESAYNNSVSAATGLAPDEVHIGHLPRPPLTVFESPSIGGHQSLNRDQLAHIGLATARQQRAYRAVWELHAV